MATFFCEFDAQEILSPCPEKKNHRQGDKITSDVIENTSEVIPT